jgi:hypothetical protein
MNKYKLEFAYNVAHFNNSEIKISNGAVISVLNKACGGDGNRRLVMRHLTGKTSSKQFTEAEWYAMYLFVKPIKPDGGHWQSEHGDEILYSTCNQIISDEINQEGKFTLPFENNNISVRLPHCADCGGYLRFLSATYANITVEGILIVPVICRGCSHISEISIEAS